MANNFLDNVGKFINESCCGYYSQGTSIQGGATPAMLRALKGMYAVDTPIDGINGTTMGTGNSIRSQVAKQAEYTLQQRNFLLSQIDRISGHWIAYAIKAIIASDGFNDLCSKYDIYIRYTDEDNKEKSEKLSEDIGNLLRRTGFLDILKDCVMNEGLDYCELFLTTPVINGYGVEYVSDNLSTRELVGIYKNTNLLGAIKFEINAKGAIKGKEFIKADQISHFLLGYKKIPLAISKNFNKKYNIPEKIRCAYPILTPVIDMIIQYDQLSKLQAALEMIKATQPIVMGVGVSAENNMTEIIRQLQEWGLTLNENKNNIVGSLDTCDVSTILQSMYNILMIPYSVDEGVNALKQVAVNFPDSNLSEVLDDLRRSIALALGIPEQYIALVKGGAKENKDDHISTNPRYSKMLSMIQQSLSKGIIEFIYKHLKSRYTNAEGILTEVIDKNKIEVLFKSSTNINNKLEDERLMLKAENMQSMVSVIDTIASSPNIPAKVNGDQFLEYWRTQMEKDPHIRNMFDIMTEEELRQMQGIPADTPAGGGQGQGEAPTEIQTQPVQQEEEGEEGNQQAEQVQSKQAQPQVDSKQEQVIKTTFQ
jgi:hypothetical protein